MWESVFAIFMRDKVASDWPNILQLIFRDERFQIFEWCREAAAWFQAFKIDIWKRGETKKYNHFRILKKIDRCKYEMKRGEEREKNGIPRSRRVMAWNYQYNDERHTRSSTNLPSVATASERGRIILTNEPSLKDRRTDRRIDEN